MSGRQLRGVASMTNTEVEAANRAIAATGSGFVFVPTLDMAAGSKSSRTPHIHFDAQGNDIGEKVPAHSASAPVPKKQKAPRPPGRPAGEPRVRTQAPPPWPGQPQSLTQQRSKRPKLQARASTGGAFRDDEKAGNSAELKACAKLLKEVMKHTFAWPFLKAVDPTFAVNTERGFQARNADAYEVELLIAPSRADALARRDRPRPIPLPEQEWLLLGTPVDQVVPCRDGSAARIVAPDPRWFALHKLWLGRQAKRDPLKRRKDLAQGNAVLEAVAQAMPHYPLDAAFA